MKDKLNAVIAKISAKLEPYIKTNLSYLLKSGFWLNMSYAVGTLISFGLSILFAHFVSKEVYGTYRYILSVAGMATAFSLTGMNVAVMRSVSQGYDGIFKKSLIEQLKWAWPQFLFSFIAGAYYLYQGNTPYAIALFIVSVLGPISSVANTFSAVLYGKKEFRTSTAYGTISNVAYFVGMVAAILGAPHSLIILIIGYYALNTAANIYFCLRTYKRYRSLASNEYRQEDISYARHLSFMNIIGTLATQADSVLVYYMLGPVSLALYAFATLLPERIRVMFGFISTAAFPKIAEKDLGNIRSALKRKTWQLILLALIISAIYIAVAPTFFKIFYPQYQSIVIYSQVFSLSLIAIATNISLTSLQAHRKQKELYIISAGVPILKIAISAVGIFYLGLWGAIIAKMAHHVLLLASSSFYLHKES